MAIAVKKQAKVVIKPFLACPILLDFSALFQIFCPGLQTKVCFRINRFLIMLFCYFWSFDFSNLRITFAKKKLFVAETSNFQVKFCSMVAFLYKYFKHYRYFILPLIRRTNRKFWWNEIASSRKTTSFTWIFQK